MQGCSAAVRNGENASPRLLCPDQSSCLALQEHGAGMSEPHTNPDQCGWRLPAGERAPSAPADQEYFLLGKEASSQSEEGREPSEDRLFRPLRATRTCSTMALCRWTCVIGMLSRLASFHAAEACLV